MDQLTRLEAEREDRRTEEGWDGWMEGGRGVDRGKEEPRGLCDEHAAVSIALGENREIHTASH